MPELELRRDPLGANRGKSFRQHAGRVSQRVKKAYHDKFYIPPYRPSNRNWEMTFSALGFDRKTVEKFWRLFRQINRSSGAIQLDHFLAHFCLDWTPWTERCFRYFDTTGGGDIDFLEFMISVWNVCTFKVDSLSNFAFDMYDLDSDGELSVPELEGMVGELYGQNGGNKCLKEAVEFAEHRGGALKLNSFIAFTASHQMLLFPMFNLQRKLQKRVFGTGYWERIEKRAKDNYGNANKNEFNPRHVQILLRTYQTGGAVAVLSHTGDPNQGLREWYVNEKERDTQMIADSPGSPEGDTSDGGKNVAAGKKGNLKETLEKMRSFKRQYRPNRKQGESDGPAGGTRILPTDDKDSEGADERTQTIKAEPKPTIPPNVARDLERIRAKRAKTLRHKEDKHPGSNQNDAPIHNDVPPTTAGQKSVVPSKVAEDLRRIRAKRTKKMLQQQSPGLRQSKPRGSSQNTRQREAGSIYFKQETGRRGWLE